MNSDNRLPESVTVYQGFRDKARIHKTNTISADPQWDWKSKNVCTNIVKNVNIDWKM